LCQVGWPFSTFFGVLNYRNLFCDNALLLLIWQAKKLFFLTLFPPTNPFRTTHQPEKGLSDFQAGFASERSVCWVIFNPPAMSPTN
jgi:hypothetical protein